MMNIEKANRPVAIALDLGSTSFKLGILDESGKLEIAFEVPSPELRGTGLIREGDPEEFLSAATRLLDRAAHRWPGLPLGLVSQRSTFTVWNRASGQPMVPMISWQDRRAADWCAAHPELEEAVRNRAGLLLSPHYVGPKLAALQGETPEIANALNDGEALIGTLDAWMIWHWSQSNSHRTDLTMAARTALADIERGDWSSELSGLFEVAVTALPGILPTDSQAMRLRNGLQLNANIADQASGAIAVLDPAEDVALVNFGTGAFVLYPQAARGVRKAGYLTAPVLATADGGLRFVLEGTINGAGPALDRFDSGPTELPTADSCADGFAIPDLAGIGSPHWREDIDLTLSAAAMSSPPAIQRRIVLEGLLFRVLEILFDLGDARLPDRVLISGGLVRDPAIGLGLACLLNRPVEQLIEPETTLLGAARLAAGFNPFAHPATRIISPTNAGTYLAEKYGRWRDWFRELLVE